MKRIATVSLLLLALSESGSAQQLSDIHQHTTSPPSARFEIQSELAARWTFRLDRFTGHVAQLVKTSEDDNSWENMPVADLPAVTAPLRPRFQLFASGVAAKYTFLIDADTGKTWVLVTGKGKRPDGTEYEFNSWQAFAE